MIRNRVDMLGHGDMQAPAEIAVSPNERLGRQISFGLQQTLACWATDFIDPPISRWLQNRFGDHAHEVTHAHVWSGEFIGDSAAFVSYLLIKQLFARPVDALVDGVQNVLDSRLTTAAHRAVGKWAHAAGVSPHDPEYARRLQAYKHFQAENIVDSSIVAGSATLLNVATQRAMGNRQKLVTILSSKVCGAAITMATMLGVRTAFPEPTRKLDEVSGHYFSKAVNGVKGLLGVGEAEPAMVSETGSGPLSGAPLIQRELADAKRQAYLLRMRAAYRAAPQDIEIFRHQQRQICQAFIMALSPDGAYAQALSQAYYHALAQGNTGREELRDSARTGIQSVLLNRRDDMLARMQLLNSASFLSEITSSQEPLATQSNRHETIIAGLVQDGEPAIHILAAAKGQASDHQALASTFDPSAEPAQILAAELRKHLPRVQAQEQGRRYSEERVKAARATVEEMKLGGPIVREAVLRSESLRRARGSIRDWRDYVGEQRLAPVQL